MIVLTDDRVVSILNSKFGIAANRIIYGQLEVARNYWTRYCEKTSTPTVPFKEFPFLAFYRVPVFNDEDRQSRFARVIDNEQSPSEAGSVEYTPCVLQYTVEILGESVINQIDYFRKYFFWANKEPSLDYTDDNGVEWRFKVVCEDPEDNSDLEAEEETGRVVRTTFNFRVDTFILNVTTQTSPDITGYITEILQNIHLYDISTDQSTLADTETIN